MYQPSPAFTPTVSATISVRNDAPSPMNRPTKMLGIAAGIATRKIRYAAAGPSVRATSRYDARTLAMPDGVSIVTGNQTASAISETAERTALREEHQRQRDVAPWRGSARPASGPACPSSGPARNQPIRTPQTSPATQPAR